MSQHRTLPPVIDAPTHGGIEQPCVTFSEVAVMTMQLTEGAFAAIVLSRPGAKFGALIAINREEAKAMRALLDSALDDADRIMAGLAPYAAHAASTRQ